ncbi:hypothetical protein [Demequina soli]|uniref:hypothetical protein n=1 Tax=Demequina soli TaxID=1638987 RepID=UPI000781AA87|nr:hypothetical protein [Demequina soli]
MKKILATLFAVTALTVGGATAASATPPDPGTDSGCCPCYCAPYSAGDNTAWAAGTKYVNKGNWGTYTRTSFESNPTIWAGRNNAAGVVIFHWVDSENLTIEIALAPGAKFADGDAVKIQPYAFGDPRLMQTPVPGHFELKYDPTDPSHFEVTVPLAYLYGIHLDITNS